MIAARIALVLAAVAAITYGASHLRDQRHCASATAAATAATGDGAALQAAHDVEQWCPGASDLTLATGALARVGLHGPALALAHEAVLREPRNYITWAALWFLLGNNDPAAAAQARARTHALNPRYAPTAPPRS